MARVPLLTVAAALCTVCGALGQNRQLLDLSAAPSAPAPGAGAGALALAESLAADAANIDKSLGPATGIRAEVRRLARDLIASGERAGQPGSGRIVLGRTLVTALPDLDRLIAASADDPILIAAAGDIAAARKTLEGGQADPDIAVRDALAVLSKLAGHPPGTGGWIEDRSGAPAEPLAPKLQAWLALPGMSPEAIEALRRVDEVAESAASWPAYQAAAIRTRAMALDAAASFDGAPAWLPDDARRILCEQFAAAISGLGDPGQRGNALDDLARLTAIADLIRKTDALEDNPAGKRIRAGVAQAVAIPPAQADARAMASFTQIVAMIASRASWPDEKSLIRQIRPAYRFFAAAARQSEQQIMTALPDVLRKPEAMTDPGTLASLSAHRQAVADVQGLLAVNAAFSVAGEGEPIADKPWQAAANRVLKLSQELSRADQKEQALASLRSLFAMVSTSWRLPGEDALREAVKAEAGKPANERDSPWARLSGGREAALVSEITDRRAGWLFDWEKAIAGGSDVMRLAAIAALLELMQDAAPVVDVGEAYATLQAWPGWELSAGALNTIAAGLADQAAEATRLLLAGDTAKAVETIGAARKDFAAALVAGRLALEAQRRGISAERSSAALLRELTAGGPIKARSWMGRHTEILDDVCRYAEEISALRKLGARDKADAVQKFANSRAAELLADWPGMLR
jgi:hypothetical protein